MYQSWRDLLFAHWEYAPEVIQATLPKGLTVDTYQGRAYLGVVPFFMRNIRPRFCPAVPGISNFLEMNLRTYVYDSSGTPGVWFYSLDANQWLAVRLARKFFHLPYYDAKMTAKKSNKIYYEVIRKSAAVNGSSSFSYRGGDIAPAPAENSLEFFLIERYVLFAEDSANKKLYSGRVYHRPYSLLNVDAKVHEVAVLEQAGFAHPKREPDHLAMSAGVDVEIYPVEVVT